jgi:HD domain
LTGPLLVVLLVGLWLTVAVVALAVVRAASLADRATERGGEGEAGAAARGADVAPRPIVQRRGPALSIDPGPERPVADTGYGSLVLDRLVRHACSLLAVEQAAIFVRDDGDPRVVVPVAGCGIDEEILASRLAVDEGAVGLVMRTGRTMWLGPGQAQREPGLPTTSPRTGAWAPIRGGGPAPDVGGSTAGRVVRGAFLAAPRDPERRIDAQGLELLSRLADLAAAALEDAPMRSRIEPAMQGGVTALEAALQLADPFAAAHSAQVAALSRMVAEQMGLDAAALLEVELAGRLFDVGRVAGGGRFAPGAAGPGERSPNGRPQLGAQVVARVPGLEVVAIIVRHHGERFDGRGRPDGLAGERIPLASRIVAACDAYAVLTSEGPGGGGLAWQEALGNLDAVAGSRFDPAVLRAVEHVIERATLTA